MSASLHFNIISIREVSRIHTRMSNVKVRRLQFLNGQYVKIVIMETPWLDIISSCKDSESEESIHDAQFHYCIHVLMLES
jgi:NAD(P)H-flavin reductase